MNDDWRVRAELAEPGLLGTLTEGLRASQLEHELDRAFASRVVVSSDGPLLFCYAGSRAQAEAADAALRRLAAERHVQLTSVVQRWHPEAEAWQAPDVPLPETPEQIEAEHEQRIATQREEATEQGYPSFEVRIHCTGEVEARAFASRLVDEGLPVVRRGHFLLIGAADEDSAQAVAERAKREAPDGSSVVAEGTMPAVMALTGPNPFAIFGGLGG